MSVCCLQIMMSVRVTPVSLGALVLILWGPTSVSVPPGGQAGTVITVRHTLGDLYSVVL